MSLATIIRKIFCITWMAYANDWSFDATVIELCNACCLLYQFDPKIVFSCFHKMTSYKMFWHWLYQTFQSQDSSLDYPSCFWQSSKWESTINCNFQYMYRAWKGKIGIYIWTIKKRLKGFNFSFYLFQRKYSSQIKM